MYRGQILSPGRPTIAWRQDRVAFWDEIAKGEKTDDAAGNSDAVASLLKKAQAFDDEFQKQIPPVLYLPGPKPPAPGQVRTPADDIGEWLKLTP